MPNEELLAAARDGTVLSYWARERPDAPAVASAAGDRTWAELDARVNQLARALRARGATDDAGVVLLCGNRPEFVEVWAAAQRAGLRLTTVNWHLTGEEAGYIVDDCEAAVFVAEERFGGVAAEAAELAPRLVSRLAVGGDIPGFEPYEDAVSGMDDGPLPDPALGSVMLYTSGTTGRPKGVHRERDANVTQILAQLVAGAGLHASDHRSLITGPLYHAAPLTISLSIPMLRGIDVVLMDGWSAEETLALIERHRITHMHVVPTMFHRLLALPDEVRSRYDLSSLEYVIHGAAPCPVEVKQAMFEWWGPIIHEYYSATEGAGTIVAPEDWLSRPGTVGKPATDDHVLIRDDEGNDVGAGEIGTVWLKAPEAGRFTYFKDDAKTDGSYDAEGRYFTLGDVGFVDSEGWLFLTDRSAHLIISGGVNIYPAEVEAVLLQHPAVGDVAVIGIPSVTDLGEDVLAVVEPQQGVGADDALGAELIAFCRDRLARFKCPRRVDFVDKLPRADTGKLAKHRLRDQYRAAAPS